MLLRLSGAKAQWDLTLSISSMFVQIPHVALSDPNKNNDTDGERKALKAVAEKQLDFH